MNHVDLFTGIGGFHLAGEMVWGDDFNTIVHVEIDKFCQKVLKKHWPSVPIILDIRDVTYERILSFQNRAGNTGQHDRQRHTHKNATNRNKKNPTIDLLTGGFPCQPFSCAGKQGGEKDDRYLWPEMLRVISEIRPTWVIGENVAGIINLALDQVLSDLENEGYACQPFIIPACAKDAPHRRDRVWIVAYSDNATSSRQQQHGGETLRKPKPKRFNMGSQDVAYAGTQGLQKSTRAKFRSIQQQTESFQGCEFSGRMPKAGGNWLPEPNVGRVAHGIPSRVDRLKSLGNAIVPQVIVPIMEAINNV